MSDYNRRVWLNPTTSTSTGSIVCCHIPDSTSRHYTTFVEIADCRGKITLHPDGEELSDFIQKLNLLKNEIDMFITELEIDIKQISLIERPRKNG